MSFFKCLSIMQSSKRLDRNFFSSLDTIDLAKKLLGQVMCRSVPDRGDLREKRKKKSPEKILRARIVETEAYLGKDDTASMSFNGRRTEANEPMYMIEGTAFVYMTYGMYHLINISSSEEGGAVLIRALEPLEEIDTMRFLRSRSRKNASKSGSSDKQEEEKRDSARHRLEDLCSGPAKLCLSLDITRDFNKEDLVQSNQLWFEEGIEVKESEIETAVRIGLSPRAGNWATKEMRYFIRGNPHVSKVPVAKKPKKKTKEPDSEDTDAVPKDSPKKRRKVTKRKNIA